MFLARDVQAFLWMLLTAALSLFVGVMLVWHPTQGAVSLTMVLTVFFIVEGIVQIVASLSYRDVFPSQWGWMLASGIADLILAGIIIAGWPGTATWALGLIVGINLITSGAAITTVALAGREVVEDVGERWSLGWEDAMPVLNVSTSRLWIAPFTLALSVLCSAQAPLPALVTDQETELGQEMYKELKAKGEIVESSPLYETLKPIAN